MINSFNNAGNFLIPHNKSPLPISSYLLAGSFVGIRDCFLIVKSFVYRYFPICVINIFPSTNQLCIKYYSTAIYSISILSLYKIVGRPALLYFANNV